MPLSIAEVVIIIIVHFNIYQPCLQASCEFYFWQQWQRQERQPAGPAVLPGGEGSGHRPCLQGGPVHQDRLLTCHRSCLPLEHRA